MENSIMNPGLSVRAFAQPLPSVTALERPPQVALQRAGAASSAAQKSETPAETRQAKPSKDLVQEEVAFANAIAKFLNQKVSFSYDERIDQIVVKVTRGNSEEVIRQIPTEETIELMAKFRKDFRGLIFDRTG